MPASGTSDAESGDQFRRDQKLCERGHQDFQLSLKSRHDFRDEPSDEIQGRYRGLSRWGRSHLFESSCGCGESSDKPVPQALGWERLTNLRGISHLTSFRCGPIPSAVGGWKSPRRAA